MHTPRATWQSFTPHALVPAAPRRADSQRLSRASKPPRGAAAATAVRETTDAVGGRLGVGNHVSLRDTAKAKNNHRAGRGHRSIYLLLLAAGRSRS